VGFAPADDPRIALIVIVDEPQGEHRGGAVGAPIFKEIAEQSLRYLHVPPSNEAVAGKAGNTGGKGAAAAVVATDLRSAAAAVSGADPGDHEAVAEVPPTDVPLEVSLNGDDDLDGEWDAVAGAEGPRAEGSVPASVVIPNFAGMSLAEAIRAARRSGVELTFDEMVSPASGVAIKQKPGPGPATRGALCRVAFGHRE
jgi:hypothetical protein